MIQFFLILGILTFSVLAYNLTQYLQKDYIILSEHFDFVFNDEAYISKLHFKNYKYNRTHFGFNSSWTFEQDLNNSFKLVVQAFRFASNEYRIFPLSFPADMCEVLSKNIFGVENLYRCGNMFRCPIKKGSYSICNWMADYTQFPPFIPKGRYMIDMKFFTSERKIMNSQWYMAIVDV